MERRTERPAAGNGGGSNVSPDWSLSWVHWQGRGPGPRDDTNMGGRAAAWAGAGSTRMDDARTDRRRRLTNRRGATMLGGSLAGVSRRLWRRSGTEMKPIEPDLVETSVGSRCQDPQKTWVP